MRPLAGFDIESVNAAIASARTVLGLEPTETATTWPVARIRPGGPSFVLVVFGPPERVSAIAAVDPRSAQVLESAHLPGGARHALIDADDAIARAGFGPGTQARLVWESSPASRSRFYPLWELESGERRVWVDSVRGAVWHALDTSRGGGSVAPM